MPDEIAVVGVDNNRIGRYISPKLSTVDQPKIRMGRAIVKKLLHQLERDAVSEDRVLILESELIVRESSMAKRG
ncbi:substrate-binding domain-containing protein [Paenibacillus filicis]|uniref:Substrate-binding domain-containing protein n=1 Tax=Paenibacillus gyeongsangnamensis TaxID=3388067 RepID=A0ABT4Q4R0_9BACL|nr:substrate-binding domain-containing protein [Paenibacillus filicis]MCZ8511814.1 substrate-binding domain-containing protein [Paenibacillus filicis]